ncbi:MAG: GNAT family N-acetyltransferase [Gaiellaceae bacterium]
MSVPELRGERVTLRPLALDDVPRVVELGREPEVARWWPDITTEALLADALGNDDVIPFVVELEGELIGLAEAWEEKDPQYRHAGIDLFLASAFHGRGLGTDTVRTLARHLIRDRGHHRVTIDPRLDNERAIRCYERVGFKRVGVQRRYELGPDGVWHDGLLLDLLADEID